MDSRNILKKYCNTIRSICNSADLNPKKLELARVSDEPPPALTFINAATAPTANNINIPIKSGKPFL